MKRCIISLCCELHYYFCYWAKIESFEYNYYISYRVSNNQQLQIERYQCTIFGVLFRGAIYYTIGEFTKNDRALSPNEKTSDVICFLDIFDLATYPNQILYYIIVWKLIWKFFTEFRDFNCILISLSYVMNS